MSGADGERAVILHRLGELEAAHREAASEIREEQAAQWRAIRVHGERILRLEERTEGRWRPLLWGLGALGVGLVGLGSTVVGRLLYDALTR